MSSLSLIHSCCVDRIGAEFGGDPSYLSRFTDEFSDLEKLEKIGQDKSDKLWKRAEAKSPVPTNRCGSLILYLLGISSVDPVASGIAVVREDRYTDSLPDIDTDFDPRIRDWVKQHIVEVFGASKVCSIGTYQTYKTRAVILDVARALGENVAEANAVTKRIEPLRAFEDESGEEFKVDQMKFDDICDHYPELKVYFDQHPQVRRHAEILRNQVRNMGTHAGGVIISDLELSDRIPVLYDKVASENRQVISAWAESGSMQELSSVGLVKYDILGLNNLPVISDCVRLIGQTTGLNLSRSDIPVSDREAIFLGSKRDLVGIFQFENPVTKPIADKVRMESLMDIAIVTSLIRPGPMDAMIGDKKAPFAYAARKHGESYEAPELIRQALKDTYGIMVFQEQCCSGKTMVRTANGVMQLDEIVRRATDGLETSVACLNDSGRVVYRKVVSGSRNGKKETCKMKLDNGMELVCTPDHRVFTKNRGWVQVNHLMPDDDILTEDCVE